MLKRPSFQWNRNITRLDSNTGIFCFLKIILTPVRVNSFFLLFIAVVATIPLYHTLPGQHSPGPTKSSLSAGQMCHNAQVHLHMLCPAFLKITDYFTKSFFLVCCDYKHYYLSHSIHSTIKKCKNNKPAKRRVLSDTHRTHTQHVYIRWLIGFLAFCLLSHILACFHQCFLGFLGAIYLLFPIFIQKVFEGA